MTLQCDQVQVRASSGKPLLHDISLRLQPGRLTAILGPNGAGKSTLLSVLSGTLRPHAGQVLLDGQPLPRLSPPILALRRAVMPQESLVAFDFTAREVAELGRYPHRLRPAPQEGDIVPHAMHSTGVGVLGGRVFNTLSGGEKARVHLARTLAQVWPDPRDATPRWMLLDEPTAALDLAHQHHTLALLRRSAAEHGCGVVAVLHDLNLALRYADEVLLLEQGRHLVLGPTTQVLTPQRIAQLWKVVCTPVHDHTGTTQYLFAPA